MNRYARRSQSAARQRGTAAIEFAFVFVVFFGLFYAIASYALAFMLMQGFAYAANEGARAAVAVDRLAFDDDDDYRDGVTLRVQEVVSETLSWLPAKALAKAVGDDGGEVKVDPAGVDSVRVIIEYENYLADPLIPVLTLPGLGPIPRLPDNLRGESVVAL